MKRFDALSAHDAVRVVVPTSLPDTVENLKKFFSPGAASVSYRPARSLAPRAHAHEHELSLLKRMAVARSPESWRKPNIAILEAVYQLGAGHRVITRPAPKNWSLKLRPDLSLRIALDWLAVVDGRPGLFWMQCRKTFVPSRKQLGMLGRLFLIHAEEDDLAEYQLNIIDMRFGDQAGRSAQLITLDDLDIPSVRDTQHAMQMLADGLDALRREGWQPANRKRPRDDRQAEMFPD